MKFDTFKTALNVQHKIIELLLKHFYGKLLFEFVITETIYKNELTKCARPLYKFELILARF